MLAFCDASEKTYAVTIYLRSSQDEQVTTNLIFSKSRIAPRKLLTIPQLELMSMLIGVRSLNFIQKQMKLHKNTERILWTDSKCVLHWIKNKDGKSVFVKNRNEEILADSNISFRYVNTKDNLADLPTRGISFDDLKDNQLWGHGPRWLSQDKICWPTWDTTILYKTDDPEHTKQ